MVVREKYFHSYKSKNDGTSKYTQISYPFNRVQIKMYKYLRIPYFSFRVIGINLWAQQDQRITSAPCRYYSWTLATAIIIILMGFYIYTSDQDKAIQVLTVFLQGVLCIIKSGMFVAKGRRFIKLIRNLDALADAGTKRKPEGLKYF